jgi:hypothetical protein
MHLEHRQNRADIATGLWTEGALLTFREMKLGPRNVWPVYGGEMNSDILASLIPSAEDSSEDDLLSYILSKPEGSRSTLLVMEADRYLHGISTPQDPGAFITLYDARSVYQKHFHLKREGILGIEANFYDPKIKERISQRLFSHAPHGFDTIVCVPVGPFADRDFNTSAHRALYLEKLLGFLTFLKPNGELFAQLPYDILGNEPEMVERNKRHLIHILQSLGFTCQFSSVAIKVQKLG